MFQKCGENTFLILSTGNFCTGSRTTAKKHKKNIRSNITDDLKNEKNICFTKNARLCLLVQAHDGCIKNVFSCKFRILRHKDSLLPDELIILLSTNWN